MSESACRSVECGDHSVEKHHRIDGFLARRLRLGRRLGNNDLLGRIYIDILSLDTDGGKRLVAFGRTSPACSPHVAVFQLLAALELLWGACLAGPAFGKDLFPPGTATIKEELAETGEVAQGGA